MQNLFYFYLLLTSSGILILYFILIYQTNSTLSISSIKLSLPQITNSTSNKYKYLKPYNNNEMLFLTDKNSSNKLLNYQPNIVIGLSTGRSGTLSVANLLNNQNQARVFHELKQCSLEWPNDNKTSNYFSNLSKAKQHLQDLHRMIDSENAELKINYKLIGDIASWNLPFVEHYLTLKTHNFVKILPMPKFVTFFEFF